MEQIADQKTVTSMETLETLELLEPVHRSELDTLVIKVIDIIGLGIRKIKLYCLLALVKKYYFKTSNESDEETITKLEEKWKNELILNDVETTNKWLEWDSLVSLFKLKIPTL
jgi:hypothetical protein